MKRLEGYRATERSECSPFTEICKIAVADLSGGSFFFYEKIRGLPSD